MVRPEDLVIHLGDVFIGKKEGWFAIKDQLPGRKWLVRGNHDRHSNIWWMTQGGFDAACDSFEFRGAYLTHKPARELAPGCIYNVFGHLHNIWNGFHPDDPKDVPDSEENFISRKGRLWHPWQRLLAVEYTDYKPVDFDHFISHPEKYQATGPKAKQNAKKSDRNSRMATRAGHGDIVDGKFTCDSRTGIYVPNGADSRDPGGVGTPSTDLDNSGSDTTGIRLEADRE